MKVVLISRQTLQPTEDCFAFAYILLLTLIKMHTHTYWGVRTVALSLSLSHTYTHVLTNTDMGHNVQDKCGIGYLWKVDALHAACRNIKLMDREIIFN